MLPIPTGSRQYLEDEHQLLLDGQAEEVKCTIGLDQGCHGFAITHEIKIGYFMTFKVLKGDGFELMRCPHHDPTLAMIDEWLFCQVVCLSYAFIVELCLHSC
jgi:hypothetical protein